MSHWIFAALACITATATLAAPAWQPAGDRLKTRWAAEVNPSAPWPEYPRPQMQRPGWVNLNGLWDYAIAASNAPAPTAWDGKILVPFPVESSLSGVQKALKPDQRLWYRRAFKAPERRGGRLLLHFEAVDWEAAVFVNGRPVGAHRGGFDAFTCDITDAVQEGANELVVSVLDATGGFQPKGKQHLPAIEKPGGIMYTPCSGIWQTTWLEVVPADYIRDVRITPDIDGGNAVFTVLTAPAGDAQEVEIELLDGNEQVSSCTKGRTGAPIAVKVPRAKLWTPDTPHLYYANVKMGADAVLVYFGMRKIALGKDDRGFTRILLNGKFVLQAGPLDQGFWPDGIYTAPTDAALRFDIEETKRLGFNMTRKHVKVEPRRWYYWCDRLGLLVWQDMPSGNFGRGGGKDKQTGELRDGTVVSEEAGRNFEAELKALIEQHWNHPSIIMWVVFNEGWGQHDTPRHVQWVRQFDPSRLVNNASGWHDIPCGDIMDMHNYPGPGCPKPTDGRAAVLGEFGGLGLAITSHTWVGTSWGYRGVANEKALTKKYVDLWRKVWALSESDGLNAAVYTQITDCETECNGLLTYDRAVCKVDAAEVAAAHRGTFRPAPQYIDLLPLSQHEAAAWRYTTTKPADGWMQPGFDDAAWPEGSAGFGNGDTKMAPVRTKWTTPDIWVRRTFHLPEGALKNPALRLFHDEDAEVFINGVPAATVSGFTTEYEIVELPAEAARTLKPGANTIAIHCRQTMGGQYIDAGLVQEK